MKIKSINFKESDRCHVTFNTEPKLQQSVFDHFKALAANDPEFKNCLPQLSEASALMLIFEGGVGWSFPADLLQNVERVLTVAESLVQNEVNAKKDQADREYQEKKTALEAVAKKWGIPIE